MNRKEIRTLSRGLVDEYSEFPQGLIKDEDSDVITMNILINIAQLNVMMDLIPYIPRTFRSSFLISLVAAKDEYSIPTDLSVTDFVAMENIYHNESGELPQGLLYVEPDQVHQIDIDVGETGDPQCWFYGGKDIIVFRPKPASAIADRFKAYYFRKLIDLNQDETHDPANSKYAISEIPDVAHPLIAFDAAMQYRLIEDKDVSKIEKVYNKTLLRAGKLLSIEPSLGLRARSPLKESIR